MDRSAAAAIVRLRPDDASLDEHDRVAFRIPDCRPGPHRREFGVKNGRGTDSVDCDSNIWDFENQNGLVRGGVVLDTFPLSADKPVADSELGVVLGIVFIKSQSERVSVKVLRRIEMVEVELHAGKAGGRGGHTLLLPICDGETDGATA